MDQIGFILAHEIGHDVLRHVYEDNERFCENYFNPQFKKTFKQTSRTRIGRNTQMRNLVNGFFANHMSYSRANELEADSLGYVLATNAGFPPGEAFQALEVLGASDYLRYTDTLPLNTLFDFENYRFKSYWLNTDNSAMSFMKINALEAFPDSLKSHPDCDERIEKLRVQLSERDSSFLHDQIISDELKDFNDIVSFETLGAVMESGDYVVALYLALHFQQKYPDNIYLKSIIAHCIFELSEAMVENYYLDYVEFPGHEFTPGYNHLLTFLHNMTSSSLKNIFQSMMDEKIGNVSDHRYVSFLKIVSDPDAILTDESIAEFDSKYHDSYLTNLLKERLLLKGDE